MKKLFVLATALFAALTINAAVIEIDLNSAAAMVYTNCTATPTVADGVLTVNYTAGGWEWAGVEFPLNSLTNVSGILYDYKGDGATGFDEGIVLFAYLRDDQGNRWVQSDYWPNLQNDTWQNEFTKPNGALDWDNPGYDYGTHPFTRLGFIANPGLAYTGTFQLKNIKVTTSSGDDPVGGKVKPLTFNGDVLSEYSGFTRSQIGTVSSGLNLDEVSGIACSRTTPGYIWMESDNFGDYIVATTEQGQQLAMKVKFPNLNTLGIRDWDWEDLCGGVYNNKNYLFVGAFGDNDENDDFYSIVYFEEPAITNGEVNIDPAQIHYVYPDGKSHNCESLMYDNVDHVLYIITKVYYDVCQVFSLPFRTDYGTATQTLTYVCDLGLKSDIGFNEKGVQCLGFHLATGADISPDGKYILIKNHNNIDGYADYSWILYWERQDGESVAQAVKRQPKVIDCYEHEWQGEAVCWLDDYTFYTTSDSDGEPPIFKYTRQNLSDGIQSVQKNALTGNKLVRIGGVIYLCTDKGLYTLDGRRVK